MNRDPETYKIIGCAQKVHSTLGFGFLEKVYQSALEIELKKSNIRYEREKAINIFYDGSKLGDSYYADFVCFDSIIVELKALKRLSKIEEAQVIHYLKATGLKRALLINFGATSLEVRRFINGTVETI